MTKQLEIGNTLEIASDRRLIYAGDRKADMQIDFSLTCGLTGKRVDDWRTTRTAVPLTDAQIAAWTAKL